MGNLPTGRASVGIAIVAVTLAACAVEPAYRPVPATAAPRAPAAPMSAHYENPVARLAMQMIGVPYRYGGADPAQGFDCSGLVYYTYTATGLAAPRTSLAQFKAARKIALGDATEGDLVFFQDQEKLSHVGIYVGDGLFVHAPATGSTVSVASLEAPYYQQHLVAVGRLLPN